LAQDRGTVCRGGAHPPSLERPGPGGAQAAPPELCWRRMASPAPGAGGYPGAGGDAAAPKADPFKQEILRLRAANQAASKENSKLRGEVSDRKFEAEQLDKQIRKLEKKIESLEDGDSKSGTVSKGFFKPMPADYQCPPVERKAPEQPKPKPWEKLGGGNGCIIDGATGTEVDPKAYWPDDFEKEDESNILLRKRGHSPEAELMWEMQHPIEVNPEFDTKKYAELLGNQKSDEAEMMIKDEGGPTTEQMQRNPLEVLRKHQNLDPNWCDPKYNNCSLLQWACSMNFDQVVVQLLQRGADANHKTQKGVSCLSSACAQNGLACARHLLDHGADPNEVVDAEGRQTLLMWASRIEYCDKDGGEHVNPFVALLLQYSSDHRLADAKGRTALMHASTQGNVPAVEALLKAKADVDTKDAEGNTALQLSLRYYHGKISSLLLAHRKKAPAAAKAPEPAA